MMRHAPALPVTLAVAIALVGCGNDAARPADAGPADAAPPDAGRPDAVPGSPAQAELSVTEVAFGAAACGGDAPAAQTVRLTNGGGTALTWTATMRFSPAFRVTGATGGELAPGDTIDLTIVAEPVAAATAAGTVLRDVLLVTHSDTSRGPFEVPVTAVATGATLTFAPSLVDFGLVTVDAAAPPIPLTLTNTGNQAIEVAVTSPDTGGLSVGYSGGPGAVTLAAGASLAGAFAAFTPTSTSAVTATAPIVTTGAICGASARTISLRGQGSQATAVISPALVDFAEVDCGSTTPPRQFFVANTGTQAFSWGATLARGDASRFTLVPDAGTVGPGGSQLVTVYSDAMPTYAEVTPDLFGEDVTVTTSAPGAASRTIHLQQTARGAILEFVDAVTTTPSIDLTQPDPVTVATAPLALRNRGNLAARVTVGTSRSDFSVEAFDLDGGAEASGMLSFTPATLGVAVATLSLGANVTVCQPLGSAEGRGDVRITGPGVGAALEMRATEEHRTQGSSTACARLRTGHVACLGGGLGGQRGVAGSFGASQPTLVHTAAGLLDDVTALSSGRDWFCARRDDDTQWCWGNLPQVVTQGHSGARGGNGVLPVATERFADLASVDGAGPVVCGRKLDGGMRCVSNALRPESIADAALWTFGTDVLSVATHSRGGYALRGDRRVWSFGSNQRGERGYVANDADPAAPIPGLTDVLAVDASGGKRAGNGSKHACALREDRTVWCWGRGGRGRLGDGSTDDRTTPVQVLTAPATPLTGVTAISVGREFSCAVTASNVYCWGRGGEGQLGVGDNSESAYARATVPALTDVVALHSAGRLTCATLGSGGVRCWGQTGWIGNTATPTAIPEFEPSATP